MTTRISTVSFLRTLAKGAGDLSSARGQALHRAAGHFVRMDEELQRCSAQLAEADVDRGAQGIALLVRERTATPSGEPTMPEWPQLAEEQQNYFRDMARACLGAPVYERPTDAE